MLLRPAKAAHNSELQSKNTQTRRLQEAEDATHKGFGHVHGGRKYNKRVKEETENLRLLNAMKQKGGRRDVFGRRRLIERDESNLN